VVEGSAVFERPRTSPVSVLHDTPVNLIHSLVFPDFRNNRPLVTVGTVATYIVVSAADSLADNVDT